MRKLTIKDMKSIAKKRGGKCLSEFYVNSRTKLSWECAKKHRWEATPDTIKSGSWCKKCSYNFRGISRRLTIEMMQEIAKQRGGKCLSEIYVNNHTSLLWKCARGHQWKAKPIHIKRGSWCPHCAGLIKLTIEDMQEIAKQRGGKCLSDSYVNNSTKLAWECAEGHQWEAKPNSVKRGHWCQKCAGKAKGTIEEMRSIAERRGGKCLSKTYVNSMTPLRWECGKGHKWKAMPSGIKSGKWCRKCSYISSGISKRSNIEEMRSIAEKRGGKCLSKTYVNSITPLLWKCDKGHKWEAMPSFVKAGSWCLICAGKAKGTIEEMRSLAKERGGRCLSNAYVNVFTKLLWECAEGHQWEAKPNVIKNGCWCQDCSSGLGERICRVFFEQVFNKKFPRSHPRWLANKRGNQMELDGFCQSLALAFEHHGEQHYSTKGKFIKTKIDLKKRQDDDRFKRKLCSQRGIVLIEIPEIPNRLSMGEIKAYIKKECIDNGVFLPSDYDTKEINIMKAYTTSNARASLEEIQKIAKERGGKCLSKTYVSSNTKLLWECSEKHKWKATPSVIRSGSWCRKCSYVLRGISKRSNIEEMQKIAKQRGGKCLSDSYVNGRTKHTWECAKGHQWEVTPQSIKKGSWCPHCAGSIKLTIGEMQEIAKQRGGKCLSKTYVDNRTPLRWKCGKGHKWEAMPSDVKGGSWCHYCGGSAKLTIEEMQKIAKQRGGKCLSDTYINAHTKLTWECAEGHQWEAKPNSIKSGRWCGKCANRARKVKK